MLRTQRGPAGLGTESGRDSGHSTESTLSKQVAGELGEKVWPGAGLGDKLACTVHHASPSALCCTLGTPSPLAFVSLTSVLRREGRPALSPCRLTAIASVLGSLLWYSPPRHPTLPTSC